LRAKHHGKIAPTLGWKVLVFVDEQEPDPVNWQLALDWDADGIQTDAPRELMKFLIRREGQRKSGQRER
jgi:hypothetical protein